MGLFSRKDSAAAGKGQARRLPVSSEIQAAELRARARRRLAGAVILVLAAVIILPMVLDSRPTQVADNVSVRIPSKDAPYQPAVSDPQAQQAAQAATPAPAATPPAAPAAASTTGPAATPAQPIPEAPAMADLQRSLAKEAKQETKPEPAPAETKPTETRPPEARPAPVVRTDNGAVAMALLEGRKPPTAAPTKPASGAHGNYVLQIAAYSVQADAQSRYAKLRQSGITDAYIEPYTTSSGKTQYRLRVGPFPSREAAQATQARLRALGFDNGFIAAK